MDIGEIILSDLDRLLDLEELFSKQTYHESFLLDNGDKLQKEYDSLKAKIECSTIIGSTLMNRISINPQTQCWEWTGTKDTHGYGTISIFGKTMPVHKLLYRISVQDSYQNLELDHKCRVRHCCNPNHLELVPHKVNIRRGNSGKENNHNAKKTHCPQGHEYSVENTKYDKKGRLCITCYNERNRK